jgi:hypothetical protein
MVNITFKESITTERGKRVKSKTHCHRILNDMFPYLSFSDKSINFLQEHRAPLHIYRITL